MSFDGTGGRGPSLQDLFGFLHGLRASGSDPNEDPIAQAQADIARRARLPKVGGLFGGDYARFMADNAPPSALPNAPAGLGAADPAVRAVRYTTDGQAGAGPAATVGARRPPWVVNAETGQPYNDAQEATYRGMIERGELDPSAQPGARGFPRGMPGPGVQPRPGDWYVDLKGQVTQADAAPPPVAAAVGAYRSARRGEGKSTVYVRPDGSEDVYDGGTMAWRNNNPGNLIYGDFARSHGAIGFYTNDNGTFAVFPDEAAGVSAMRELLKIPKYQQKPVDQVIKSYAPATENNTPAYQAFVRNALGVDGSTRLDSLSADQVDKLIETIRKREGARPGTVTSRPGAAR